MHSSLESWVYFGVVPKRYRSRILNTSSLIINKTPLVISNHTTGNVQKAAVIVRQFFVFSFIFKNLSSVLFDILIDLRSDSVIKGVRGISSSFLALWRRFVSWKHERNFNFCESVWNFEPSSGFVVHFIRRLETFRSFWYLSSLFKKISTTTIDSRWLFIICLMDDVWYNCKNTIKGFPQNRSNMLVAQPHEWRILKSKPIYK